MPVKLLNIYKIHTLNNIIGHIKHFSKSSKIDCWLFFVPERTMICERVLEEEGVKGDITIGSYAMDWIPYEDDLISMELDPSTWKEIYLVKKRGYTKERERLTCIHVYRTEIKLLFIMQQGQLCDFSPSMVYFPVSWAKVMQPE